MRQPIIIEGQPFDWEEGKRALDAVQNEDGSTNWKAAFCADPGCTSCPACKETYWAEGTRQRCAVCGFEYPTHWWPLVAQGRDHRRWHDGGTGARADFARIQRAKYQYPAKPEDMYYMWGWNHPNIACDYRAVCSQDWKQILATWNAGKQIVDALDGGEVKP